MSRYSVHCKGCKTHATVADANGQAWINAPTLAALADRFGGVNVYGKPATTDRSGLLYLFEMLRCGRCGRHLRIGQIRGRYSARKACNATCTDARGHDCECQCGGKNHGAGYSVAVGT
jgi:hypothetical protein